MTADGPLGDTGALTSLQAKGIQHSETAVLYGPREFNKLQPTHTFSNTNLYFVVTEYLLSVLLSIFFGLLLSALTGYVNEDI